MTLCSIKRISYSFSLTRISSDATKRNESREKTQHSVKVSTQKKRRKGKRIDETISPMQQTVAHYGIWAQMLAKPRLIKRSTGQRFSLSLSSFPRSLCLCRLEHIIRLQSMLLVILLWAVTKRKCRASLRFHEYHSFRRHRPSFTYTYTIYILTMQRNCLTNANSNRTHVIHLIERSEEGRRGSERKTFFAKDTLKI